MKAAKLGLLHHAELAFTMDSPQEEDPLLPCTRRSKPRKMSSSFNSEQRTVVSTEEQAPSPEEHSMSSRVNRKLDVALLPCLSLLYLFNGLDRSNVGNAETQGFTKDIGATPDDLNLAVSLFFVTFVLLQPPSAAVGRWLGAKHWITIIMASQPNELRIQSVISKTKTDRMGYLYTSACLHPWQKRSHRC
jgi:hypothetical protein